MNFNDSVDLAENTMSINSDNSRLSRITTNWDEIFDCQRGERRDDAAAQARNAILLRYGNSIYRYILGASRNCDVADDLAQEFALRFVRGDYRNVDPSKGRFRDYLKTSLRNLVTDHFRKKPTTELSSSAADRLVDDSATNQLAALEQEFQIHWRQEILSHAWIELREFEAHRQNHFYTVLHFRAENPQASSSEIAAAISASMDRTVSAEWVRQNLHRARQKFAELLIAEVRESLISQDEDSIQDELKELGLQKYS